MTGHAAAKLRFAESSALLRELAGSTLIRNQWNVEVANDERHTVEPEPRRARTLHLRVDSTGVPVRKTETAGRAG